LLEEKFKFDDSNENVLAFYIMQKNYPKQLDRGTWNRFVKYSSEQDHYNAVLQSVPMANPEHRIKVLTKSYG